MHFFFLLVVAAGGNGNGPSPSSVHRRHLHHHQAQSTTTSTTGHFDDGDGEYSNLAGGHIAFMDEDDAAERAFKEIEEHFQRLRDGETAEKPRRKRSRTKR